MGAYSKLLGLWSPLYRSLGCDATILHLPDFDQLTVASLVNLLLMEEPPDSLVRFDMEQMELFECLNIKLNGLKEIPKDVEIEKVEGKDVKRATRNSKAVTKNVAKLPEKVNMASPVKVLEPPGIIPEEPAAYRCDLCDFKVTSIEKHLEAEHEEIMPIPVGEISTFFSIIPVVKVAPKAVVEEKVINSAPKILRKSESESSLEVKKSDASNLGVGRGFKYDGADGVKCPECPRRFNTGGPRLKDNLKCHIGNIHFSDRLLAEAAIYYISDKCKECGHNGKNNALKKKHMMFNHTKYVTEIITIVENAMKSQGDDDKMKENAEALTQEEHPPKVEDIAGGGTKRKREEEALQEEESKSLKVEPQLKVANLEKLTNAAHAEVEDLLMSDDEDATQDAPQDAQDKDADAEGDATLEEALNEDPVKDGQDSEVLSIQDQLLQMQDLSSEEDEDEDADDRLKEFVSEEESEDVDDEKGDEKDKPADGDYDIDVGSLISDEDIADDIADDESPAKDQIEEDSGEDEYVGRNESADEAQDNDLGNISDDEEEASEDNLEDVLNFENEEDDDEGDAETAPNSDNEEKNEEIASAMSTEMLEKLNNLLS